MNIENAIINLNNVNQTLREQALEICKRFQTPEFFDWNIWKNLSEPSKPNVIRLFAYSTLSIVFQEGWTDLSPELQILIFQSFPFFQIELFEQDPIKTTIIHTNSLFLIYVAPLEFIIQLFNQVNLHNLMYFSSLVTEFVVSSNSCASPAGLPTERRMIVDNFISNYLATIVHAIILQPLSQCQLGTESFSYFLSLLGHLHKETQICPLLINSPEIENFYASFAHLVWVASPDLSITWIFDSILSADFSINPDTSNSYKQNQMYKNQMDQNQMIQNQMNENQMIQNQMNENQMIQNQMNENQMIQNQMNQNQNNSDSPTHNVLDELQMPENEENIENTIQLIPIIHNLAISAPSIFLQSYSELFFQSQITDNYPNLLDSFLPKISLFFSVLDQLDIHTLCPFFSMIIVMLQSSSPSIIYEVSDNTKCLIKKHSNVPEFIEICFNQRMALFDTCIKIIAIPLDSLPGAIYDTGWDKSSIRSSVFTLAQSLSEIDNETVVKELIRMIIEQNSETPLFLSLVRLLSSSLNMALDISNEANHLTCFLFNCLLDLSNRKIKNYVLSLLIKLINYVRYSSSDSLNEFFTQLLNLFIRLKPSTIDPFSHYFMLFINKFGNNINFPIDQLITQLQTISKDDPCYYTISSLIAKFTGTETPLDSAINDIEWFITMFDQISFKNNLLEQNTFDFLNRNIIRSMDFLAQNPPKDENALLAILSKIVAAQNVLMNIINLATTSEAAIRLVSSISHFSNTLTTYTNINPLLMIQLIPQMNPPLVINECTSIWLKKIALPILVTIQPHSSEVATNYASLICTNLTPIIENLESNPETPASLENITKKVAVILCQLCRLMSNEDAIQVMQICLRLNDFRVFANISEVASEKGIHVFSLFWLDFISKREIQYTDKIIEALFCLYDKMNGDINQFLLLPGITQDMLSALNAKLMNCGSARTKRRYFRALLP
ncbi:hypothetical protein TRFO_28093 [Tritrichomonas foetus]|uniref:Uncharacterized protein n=1 Tax=Tritrichomonas foetus TaxID=1144522 RepID=A0A1J4JYZ2_9EUKA|nr:hypothetical protein TRFO_28093 [Tritrichomonas foetus]|eukprot:OHT04391.1 hypothetical protein TRFO_28093 [Tritrichomonas foetus]